MERVQLNMSCGLWHVFVNVVHGKFSYFLHCVNFVRNQITFMVLNFRLCLRLEAFIAAKIHHSIFEQSTTKHKHTIAEPIRHMDHRCSSLIRIFCIPLIVIFSTGATSMNVGNEKLIFHAQRTRCGNSGQYHHPMIWWSKRTSHTCDGTQ